MKNIELSYLSLVAFIYVFSLKLKMIFRFNRFFKKIKTFFISKLEFFFYFLEISIEMKNLEL